jgi:hypothetical protein
VIPPTLAALGRLARTEKERTVRRGEDTMHFVDVYRAGKRILRVAVPDGDDVAGLLYNAPAPLCADYIAMAADAWGSRDPANPITGQGWRLGDMHKIAHHDLGLHRGLLRESIWLSGFERDGTRTARELRYRHDRQARTITWTDEIEAEVTEVGRFPDAARKGFARPTAREAVFEHLGPPPEDCDLDDLLNRLAVSWVLSLPRTWRVLEGPKGRPLDVTSPP